MHRVKADDLQELLEAIYVGGGVPAGEAATVAKHQVLANLSGHDSHGAARTRRYLQQVEKGHIVPGAKFEVERDEGATAVINGNWGFGFVIMEQAVDLVVSKARTSGIAAVSVRHQGHIGRLGAYSELIAAQGFMGFLTADSGLGPKHVAPFGGRESRLGTNPLSFGIPGGPEGDIILDMATAAVAGGKIEMARRDGTELPPGWILDREGRAATSPMAYKNGGTLLPLGGDQGHKGYGLSFVVEVFSGLLTGLGFGIDPKGRHNDGVFMWAADVARFRDPADFRQSIVEFIAYLKDTPLAEGHTEILAPGELERRLSGQRRRDGISLDDETWQELVELGRAAGREPERV